MRAGRPIQMSIELSVAAAPTTVISRMNADYTATLDDFPGGVVNISKHKVINGNFPAAQAQDLAGPNWAGGPILTGRTYDNPRSGGRTRSLSIRNIGTGAMVGDSVLVSFDRGANFFTLQAGESFTDEVSLQFFTIKRITAVGIVRVEVMAILV